MEISSIFLVISMIILIMYCNTWLHVIFDPGHLVMGGQGRRGALRSLLRVHVHSLCVLSHPCVNEEERIFARMREIYQQYSTLLQQDNLGSVCRRVLLSLLSLVRFCRVVSKSMAVGYFDDD